MDPITVVGGLVRLLTAPRFKDKMRILKGNTRCLQARIEDYESTHYAGSKKRKRNDDDLYALWLKKGRELLDRAETLIARDEEDTDGCAPRKRQARGGSTVMGVNLMIDVNDAIDSLANHESMGDEILAFDSPVVKPALPHRGIRIPVNKLNGQGASNALEELQVMLLRNEVQRIAICGKKGIGKTALMKHLYNHVIQLQTFDYAFWFSFTDQFSIRRVQDDIAAVVKCDISKFGEDLTVRARKLSTALVQLGRIVIFLDGVPNADYSLHQLGIPLPSEWNEYKLVLTTSSNLISETLGCFRTVELDCLSEDEALNLLLLKANICASSVSALGDTPRLLTKECHGIPGKIVEVATFLSGIHDISEWATALFELQDSGKDKNPL